MRSIGRDEVRRLVAEEDAQVVEVLSEQQFRSEHIEGAVNIPLKRLDREHVAVLDPRRPVVVYCNDFL